MKKQSIISAATSIFLKNGFEATSMDAVALKAGVAKQTVYSHFKSKEALFRAIVTEQCDTLFSRLPENTKTVQNLEAYLITLAKRVMGMLVSKETLGLYRLIVAEAPRFPELGRAYYRAGPQKAIITLSEVLSKRGIPELKARIHARHFFGMVTGELLTHALLDDQFRLSAKERQEIAKNTTYYFLISINKDAVK